MLLRIIVFRFQGFILCCNLRWYCHLLFLSIQISL